MQSSRPAVGLRHVDNCTVLEEHSHHAAARTDGGKMQWRHTLFIGALHGCTVLEQHAHRIRLVFHCGHMQRGEATRIAHVHDDGRLLQ